MFQGYVSLPKGIYHVMTIYFDGCYGYVGSHGCLALCGDAWDGGSNQLEP